MPSSPKIDCETLMSAVLPFAEQMLQHVIDKGDLTIGIAFAQQGEADIFAST